MPLDLDAIAARERRAWRQIEAGRTLPLTDRLMAAQRSVNDVPALVARVRALEAALAASARLAEESARAMDRLHANERHLAFWPMLTRLRDLRRIAEAPLTANAASEGGA